MYSPSYVLATNEALLRWQFGASGAAAGEAGTLDMLIARVDGEIGGCVGYIPGAFQFAGRSVGGAWAANWMVDQKYRRLGLGPLLIRELAKQFDVTLALGGNRDAHDLLPRMGWTDFGDLPRYVGVVDPVAAAPLVEGGVLDWPSNALDRARRQRATRGVVAVRQFSDAATDVWHRVYGDVAATERSAAFLNWRYANHPVFRYRLFEWRAGERLGGFAVYRIEQARDVPVRIGRIVELVGEDGEALDLLHAMIQDGMANGVSAFDFFCSSRRIGPTMAEAGFVSGREEPASAVPLLFQPLDRTRVGVLFMAYLKKVAGTETQTDWYVTTADGDQDRPS
jgi:hypothetical protein